MCLIVVTVSKIKVTLIFFLFKKKKEKKRTGDLMEMLGLKETVFQMAKANRVRWCGRVLRRGDWHVLRKALEFEVKEKRK